MCHTERPLRISADCVKTWRRRAHIKRTMQAVVGASASPLGVPGVPVAPQGSVGQGLQGPAITAEALEDLGGGILAQESQGMHLPQEKHGKTWVNGKGIMPREGSTRDRGSMHT